MVTTGAASSVTTAGATLSGSFANMTDVRDYGIRWGTSSSSLTNESGLNSSAKSSDTFSVNLSSLEAGRTYWYRHTSWSMTQRRSRRRPTSAR